jgi:PAS domain S-box-containing protein
MASRKRADDELTRAELLEEIRRLREGSREQELERVVHELEIHHEELNVQQEQLLESQRALAQARDRFEELFDFAPIAYVLIDRSGLIRSANLAAATLLGRDRAHLIGRPFFLHVTAPHRQTMLDHIAQCRRGDLRVNTQVSLHSRVGPDVPVELTSTAMRREHGDLFLTAVVDLSERKRMEEERLRVREQQQRLLQDEQVARAASDAKDRFLAMLSHELRTPLTPILMALEAVRRHESLPPSLQTTVDMIRRNVVLETRLIDDLLDVSRIVQGKMTFLPDIVNVHELVGEVMEMLGEDLRSARLAVSTTLSATAHYVHVDPVRLRQVMWNLLHNAVRNTPADGRVTVSTANLTEGWITVSVRDTGRGIDPHMLPRIFNLFEQDEELRRRGVGLGLGLPISKTIVEAHGGSIIVESGGRGRGARVTVELPTVAEPTARRAPAASARPVPPRFRRVLLVEDNEDSAQALAAILSIHGYEVRVAGTVKEALGYVDEVDIVVSDIGLPDGTGHELMAQICARRRLPGIALSGYGTSEDVRRSTEAGFHRHIVKPVEPQHLLDALQNLE